MTQIFKTIYGEYLCREIGNIMKPIVEYAEQSVFFYENDLPSVTILPVCHYKDAEKQILLEYLLNSSFKRIAVPAMNGIDAFTGKPFNAVGELFSDGEYAWYDSLPEYVRLHNLALPDDFIEKVQASHGMRE